MKAMITTSGPGALRTDMNHFDLRADGKTPLPISLLTTLRILMNIPGLMKKLRNYFVVILILLSTRSFAQTFTQQQNFVRADVVCVPGITTSKGVNALPNGSKNTTINYYDGMGRETQVIQLKATPAGNDLVESGVTYDNMGYVLREYLPFANTLSSGDFVTNMHNQAIQFYTATPSVSVETSRPFTENTYDGSSLGRISSTYGAGTDWYAAQRKLSYKYKIDQSGTLRKWTFVDEQTAPTSVLYASTEPLSVYETMDEENQVTREYTNQQGRLVLRQIQESGDYLLNPASVTWLETYYIYDNLQRLRIIVPPAGVADLSAYDAATAENKKAFIEKWAYQFVFDGFGHVIKKRVPGATGWTLTVFDRWSRLALKQEPTQPANEWTFIKYDDANRPIMTGFYRSTQTHSVLCNQAINATVRGESAVNDAIGYSLTATFPTSGITEADINTITYYDYYNFLSNTNWDTENAASAYTFVNESGFPLGAEVYQPYTTNLAPRVGHSTGSKVRVLEKNVWLNSVIYYDRQYNILQTFQENYLGGIDRTTNAYDFTAKLTKSLLVHTSSIESVNVLREYDYDHHGRLTKTFQTTGSGVRTLLASSTYNDLGQIQETNLHSTDGTTFLQSVDYLYNVRGWMSNINNSALSTANNNANDGRADLFGMDLIYNQESVSINGVGTTKSYNGNISAIRWKTNNLKDAPVEKAYGYTYDNFNRLKDASYATGAGANFTGNAGAFNESATYDKNGNLQTLKRYAIMSGAVKLIDDLKYHYEGSGNQLKYLEDNSSYWSTSDNNADYGYHELTQFKNQGLTSPEYVYDASGRLIVDYNKGITNIRYNHLSLPVEITINGKVIEYVYDGNGVKLRKMQRASSGGTELLRVDYAGQVQYINSQLSFISNNEGRVVKKGTGYEYEYSLKDHLGNSRMMISYTNETVAYKATLETERNSIETSDFKNITRATGYNNTKKSYEVTAPQYSAGLNGAIGPAKILTIKEGDKVSLQAFARYNGTVTSTKLTAAALATAVTSAFQLFPTGETAAAYSAVNNGVLGTTITGNAGAPKAYLFYFIFSSDYTYRQFGVFPVPQAAALGFEKLSLDVAVDFPESVTSQQGFMYAYVANETTGTTVYFDDIEIVHQKITPALQVDQATDYYPFGLSIAGLSYQKPKLNSNDPAKNKILFQGQEMQDDFGLNWYQFKYRMHDPATGRFTTIDPLAAQYAYNSPYAFAENALIRYRELEGLEKIDFMVMTYEPNEDPYSNLPEYRGKTIFNESPDEVISNTSNQYLQFTLDIATGEIKYVDNGDFDKNMFETVWDGFIKGEEPLNVDYEIKANGKVDENGVITYTITGKMKDMDFKIDLKINGDKIEFVSTINNVDEDEAATIKVEGGVDSINGNLADWFGTPIVTKEKKEDTTSATEKTTHTYKYEDYGGTKRVDMEAIPLPQPVKLEKKD